ncbi:MAG: succinyldiaminopimelate transaminase [Gammaproteobacteria bacterium]|nr:succinyldiaminopimelate transaminase [Gammaproteobacteria bacterium]NNF59839.1 succinyldiaminopimelate transaminase [Gammaproteobacteria bacterium]NNM21287.1 succinyldiaminopimelate transaminase [Gammaproteobacteria bacterium]
MNPDLDRLHPYPFTRLDALRASLQPPPQLDFISLAIGEPRHAAPGFVVEALSRAGEDLGTYPQSAGLPGLRAACARWLERRFELAAGSVDAATSVLPLSGTREGLFALAQAVIDRSTNPTVLMPNPFYQIYEGAALMAGAEPVYVNATAASGFLPDLEAVTQEQWRRCQLLYLCSPGNPTGAVTGLDYLERVLALADRYGFVVAADECYAEIYRDEHEPPPSLLQACVQTGRDGFDNCVVFHSLSKRSNVPGMRSGFVAGDPRIIEKFRLYRSYHGCAMPIHHQQASIAAWNDDQHVTANRALYRAKFNSAGRRIAATLGCALPAAAFYLWAPAPGGDDEQFASQLYSKQNVLALPGSYLARETTGGNPGKGMVRLSLVATGADCDAAADRIEALVSGA